MNIMIVATEDHLGAGKAAHRLYEVMKRKGHSACMLVGNKTIDDRNIIEIREVKSLAARITRRVQNLSRPAKTIKTDPDYYFFGLRDPELKVNTRKILNKLPFKPDVIVITWISKFLNARHVYELHKMTDARVIAYPMDMSLFTGGCHYAWNSTGFHSDCDPCPAIQSEEGKKRPSEILADKKKYYSLAAVKAVAPTSQVHSQMMQSFLFKGRSISKVLLPVDETIFNAKQRSTAKKNIGLPDDSFVIFFGTSFTTEKRKGIHLFTEALQKLHLSLKNDPSLKERIIVMIGGNKKEDSVFGKIPFRLHFPGYINDDKLLSLHYQAADLFVSSSIQDAGPMMINESIMCGTPAIAFPIGVSDDLIIDAVTGYKVKLADTSEMASKMEVVLRMEKNAAFHDQIVKVGYDRSSYASFPSEEFLQ